MILKYKQPMKFTSALLPKLIYVFRINDAEHRGCLKIGEATTDNENIWGLEPNSKALNEAAKNEQQNSIKIINL